MPSRSYLSSASGVNLEILRDQSMNDIHRAPTPVCPRGTLLTPRAARKSLLDALEGLDAASDHCSSKALVIDKALVGTLGLIAEFSALKERGVEKMFPLENAPLPETCPEKILYLLRPQPEFCAMVGLQVK